MDISYRLSVRFLIAETRRTQSFFQIAISGQPSSASDSSLSPTHPLPITRGWVAFLSLEGGEGGFGSDAEVGGELGFCSVGEGVGGLLVGVEVLPGDNVPTDGGFEVFSEPVSHPPSEVFFFG